MAEKRNTVQRQLILNAVVELDIHATAEQVYEHVHKAQPSISKTTVYRNLSQMAESGELRNVGVFHGATHYDHNCHEHYHFVCDDCKKVFDVDFDFSGILKNVDNIEKHDIKGFHLAFDGTCHECAVAHSA